MLDSNVQQDKIYSKQLILWWAKKTEVPTLPSKAQRLHHYGNIPPHMKCQQNMDPKRAKKIHTDQSCPPYLLFPGLLYLDFCDIHGSAAVNQLELIRNIHNTPTHFIDQELS